MDLQLKNQVVWITGATQGLGLAMAESFLREGAHVVITGRHYKTVNKTVISLSRGSSSPKFLLGITGDMRSPRVLRATLARIQKTYGRLDVVVSNLGSGTGKRGWEAPEKEWDNLLDLNLSAPMRLIRTAIPLLSKQKSGRILFISSIAGCESLGAPIAYEIAKAGLLRLTKALARQLAPDRILVNAVAPGNILAPNGSWEAKIRHNKAAVNAYIRNEVPMQRFAAPSEIADVVTFLASPRNSFMTGSCVVVDGGQTRSL